MSTYEICLLAGLIIIGISIPLIVVPRGVERSIGGKTQFVFGVILVVVFFLADTRLVV